MKGKTGMAEAEQDCQESFARTGQPGQADQPRWNMTGKIVHAEQDIKTGKTGVDLQGKDYQSRTAGTGMQDKTRLQT
jgi:hypothetical protein